MKVRQEMLKIEGMANSQYQNFLEADSKSYEKQERKTMMDKRVKNMETMNYLKKQVPQQQKQRLQEALW